MMRQVEQGVAVVSGENSGIALATAKHAQQEGAKAILAGRSEKALERAIKAIGNGAPAIQADVYFMKLWSGV
jgi:NADP-dependent 3-hydroxy acid dehydrogenase YdfG